MGFMPHYLIEGTYDALGECEDRIEDKGGVIEMEQEGTHSDKKYTRALIKACGRFYYKFRDDLEEEEIEDVESYNY